MEVLAAKSSRTAIPRTVWVLGFVSLFMDLSSELVHSLMPVFLVGRLGVSMLTVGLIEGVAEATALIVKVFSGAISDFISRRKGLLLGYGLAALTSRCSPSRPRQNWSLPPALWIGSARGFEWHRAMHWSRIWHPRLSGVPVRTTTINGYCRGFPRPYPGDPADTLVRQ